MKNFRMIMQQAAEREMKNSKGVLYDYDIMEGLYTGICEILSITYNSVFISFDMVLRDINTDNTIAIPRCRVNLKRRAK